ncbi:MAG: DUF2812 domain-containing protein, partial [Bacilli bacterium]
MLKKLPYDHWQHREIEGWLEELGREGWFLKRVQSEQFEFERIESVHFMYLVRQICSNAEDENLRDAQLITSGYQYVAESKRLKIYVVGEAVSE